MATFQESIGKYNLNTSPVVDPNPAALRKVWQFKFTRFNDVHQFQCVIYSFTDTHNEPSLLLILKWGGELTPAGRVQAEELGRIFRCMYPGGQGRFTFSEFKFKSPQPLILV